MNGEHWAPARSDTVACQRVATAPYGGYHKCALQHEHTQYEFSERANVTTVHPDVVDYSQSTTVTIIGDVLLFCSLMFLTKQPCRQRVGTSITPQASRHTHIHRHTPVLMHMIHNTIHHTTPHHTTPHHTTHHSQTALSMPLTT